MFFILVTDYLSCYWGFKPERRLALHLFWPAASDFWVTLRFFFIFFSNFRHSFTSVFRAQYDALGGRRCDDLYDLVEYARSFTHIFIIVGDNDVKNRKIEYILEKYLEFQNAVWPSNVKFAGNMRRGDLDPVMVTNNNVFWAKILELISRVLKW